jgi:hypothetical protein
VRRSTLSIALALTLAGSLLPLGTSAAAAASAPARRMRPPTPELIERAVRRGEITEARGALYLAWAFSAPERVPEAYVSDAPWSGTLPLLELQRTLPELGDAPAAATARSALRAKTFACPGTTGSLPKKRSTKHFYIQYSTMKGATINQYAAALETTWKTEIGKFGWAKPPKDPVSYPKGGRYPVRIENLGPGLYGYVANTRLVGNNPSTPWNDRDAQASCMVLARNFEALSDPPVSPIDALRATAAHEFNHSIQFGYGALLGPGSASNVMIEALATWMEDEVFDSANDSYNYLWPNFTVPMGRYNPGFPYPYWVVFRAMAERYGSGVKNGSEKVYQTFWELIGKRKATNLKALGKGFKSAKNITLGQAFHDASIALRYLRDCSATAPPYCLEEGPAYAATPVPLQFQHPGDHANLGPPPSSLPTRKLANDLSLNWIGLPTQNNLEVQVTHDGGKGILKVSVICRDGNEVTVEGSGTATKASDVELANVDLGACDEATAVISNVKVTSATPKKTTKTKYTIALIN